MSPAIYLILFLPLLIYLIARERNETDFIALKILKNKGDRHTMLELAKKFIGKDCLIYTYNNTQISGVIQEITGNALLVENGGSLEAVNLDYVLRIREYPRGKNGKKKSLVLD